MVTRFSTEGTACRAGKAVAWGQACLALVTLFLALGASVQSTPPLVRPVGAGDTTLAKESPQLFNDPGYFHRQLPAAAAAAAVVEDFNVEYVGSCLWSGVYDVWVDGDYAYCAFVNGLAQKLVPPAVILRLPDTVFATDL